MISRRPKSRKGSNRTASREGRLKRKGLRNPQKSRQEDEKKKEELDDRNACYNTFTWGWPEHGVLGLGEEIAKQTHQVFPNTVETFGKSHAPASQQKSIACGGQHTLFLNKMGQVTSCGRNNHGQVGHLDSKDILEGMMPELHNSPVPRKVPGLKDVRIAQVAANMAASFAITIYGETYSWGCGRYGVLGHGDERDVPVPREVLPLRKHTIEALSAGLGWHALAITDRGQVFAWGRNHHGQVGNGEKGRGARVLEPHEVHFSNTSRPKKIAAGQEHSLALCETTRANMQVEAEVFCWGHPGNGRLGSVKLQMHEHPQRFSNLNTFLRRKMGGQDIDNIYAGGMHSFITTKPAQNVIAWGAGLYGALGYGFNWDQEEPQLLPQVSGAHKLAAGLRHTLCLTVGGQLWAWGHNAQGELGLGDRDPRLEPRRVLALAGGRVEDIAAGLYHSAATTAGKATTIQDDPEYKRFFNILGQHGGLKTAEGRAVFQVLRKTLDRRGMNSDLLKTPMKVLPGQPGADPGIHKPFKPEHGFKYCLDTTPPTEDFSQRGSYEAAYRCHPCRLEGICMACARACHRHHNIEVYFRFRHNVKCGCGYQKPESDCKIIWSRERELFEARAREEDLTVLFEDVEPLLEEIRNDKQIPESILEAASESMVGADDVRHKRINFFTFISWYNEFYSDELEEEGEGKG